jgi:hypothetical protein
VTEAIGVADLETVFADQAPEAARRWLAAARDRKAAQPDTIGALFPSAGRGCGRAPLADGRRTDDVARVLLLASPPPPDPDTLTELYRGGDSEEKRAVLLALDHLALDDTALPLVEDALRTSDTRLIAAALGGYAARRLSAPAYRQAVLKCVFCDIPLANVAGLPDRADAGLARMLADFARERVAAGRAVPDDVWPILVRFPHAVDDSGLRAEAAAPDQARAAAARRALHAYDLHRSR